MEKSIPSKQEVDFLLQEEFTDALFGLLADKALDRETRSFIEEEGKPPAESEMMRFSKLLDRSYTQYRRKKFFTVAYRVASRASMVIVAAFLILGVTVMNVSAIREPLMDWVFRYYSDHTEITFPDAEPAGLPEISFGYLPEGFTEVSIMENSTSKEYIVHSKEEYIRLSVHQLTGKMYIDTEGAIVRYENIGNGQIAMIMAKDYLDGSHIERITWHDNNLFYYIYSNTITEPELLKIIEEIIVK